MNKMLDPELALRQRYGDIHRLDAFPWMDDVDAHSEPVLEQRDSFDTASGRVRRYWRVAGNNGLGCASERGLYLALLLLTAEAGWQRRDINFTFRTLAMRSGLRPGPEAYRKIAAALDRLKNILVQFQGTTEISGGAARGVTITFYLISDLYKDASEGEIDCTVSWNEEVYRALRSSVMKYQAVTPEMPLEQIMSSFLNPLAPEKTRPAQEKLEEKAIGERGQTV